MGLRIMKFITSEQRYGTLCLPTLTGKIAISMQNETLCKQAKLHCSLDIDEEMRKGKTEREKKKKEKKKSSWTDMDTMLPC